MRRSKQFVLATLSVVVLACAMAGGASAAVEGINATVSQNPFDAHEATVQWDANQFEAGEVVWVVSFAVAAWDEECSAAGWPYDNFGFSSYAASEYHSFDATFAQGTDVLEIPDGPALC